MSLVSVQQTYRLLKHSQILQGERALKESWLGVSSAQLGSARRSCHSHAGAYGQLGGALLHVPLFLSGDQQASPDMPPTFYSDKIHIKLTIHPFLSVQFCVIKHIYIIVPPSLRSISGTFSPSQTEALALSSYNTPFPMHRSLTPTIPSVSTNLMAQSP